MKPIRLFAHWLRPSFAKWGSASAGEAAEHRARDQACAARIVAVEETADQFARREEARDRCARDRLYLGAGIDRESAEGKRDAAGHGIGLERRRLDPVGPVGLGRGDTTGAAAVLHGRVERSLRHHRVVVGPHGLEKARAVDAFHLCNEALQRVRLRPGRLPDAVLVPQQVGHLRVEHLPRHLTGLLQHPPAVGGVGVVAKVRTLVDEALACRVDDDREGVAVLLEAVAHGEVAEVRCIPVPGDRVAAGPVAGRHGAGLQRHADAVTLVEAGPAHLGEVPAGPEIARPPGGVGLEAAAGQHHGARVNLDRMPVDPCAHTAHTGIVGEERAGLGLVMDGDARLRRGLVERGDEARPAAPGLDGQPAPEAEAAVFLLEGLAAVASVGSARPCSVTRAGWGGCWSRAARPGRSARYWVSRAMSS